MKKSRSLLCVGVTMVDQLLFFLDALLVANDVLHRCNDVP
jgi:hypothetical protein